MRRRALFTLLSLLAFDLPVQAQTPAIGDPAPEFTLEDLDGNGPVSLGDFRGQVVFIFFLGYS